MRRNERRSRIPRLSWKIDHVEGEVRTFSMAVKKYEESMASALPGVESSSGTQANRVRFETELSHRSTQNVIKGDSA